MHPVVERRLVVEAAVPREPCLVEVGDDLLASSPRRARRPASRRRCPSARAARSRCASVMSVPGTPWYGATRLSWNAPACIRPSNRFCRLGEISSGCSDGWMIARSRSRWRERADEIEPELFLGVEQRHAGEGTKPDPPRFGAHEGRGHDDAPVDTRPCSRRGGGRRSANPTVRPSPAIRRSTRSRATRRTLRSRRDNSATSWLTRMIERAWWYPRADMVARTMSSARSRTGWVKSSSMTPWRKWFMWTLIHIRHSCGVHRKGRLACVGRESAPAGTHWRHRRSVRCRPCDRRANADRCEQPHRS